MKNIERCSTLLVTREVQIQATVWFYSACISTAQKEKEKKGRRTEHVTGSSAGEDSEQLERPPPLAGEYVV